MPEEPHTEFKYGDTSGIKPFWAREDLVKRLHDKVGLKLPGKEDRALVFKHRLLEEYGRNRNVKMAVEVCVHCGACLTACPTYITTGDIHNSPVGRADLIRSVIKAEKISGKLFGKLVGATKVLDDEYLMKVATYYYQCLECRRCSYVCPFGIDQADLTRTVRSILYEVGIISRYVATVIDTVYRTGNNLGITLKALYSIIDFVKKEIKEEKGVDVKVKIDEPAYALLVPPSADFFANIETLKGYILFLNAIGMDFTFSSAVLEHANFGLFVDERHMKAIGEKIVNEAKRLGVKLVIAGECGHGWRAIKNYVIPRLREEGMDGVHIFHLVVDAIKKGVIKLNPEANGDIVYTFQDSCNYARGGDLTEEPRFIMKHVVKKYVEPRNGREKTWCCGGGGGLLTDELMPIRIQYARLWYEDALSVGAQHVVRACAICKAQLGYVIPHLNKMYQRNITYSGLMDLLYRALVTK
ncbi:(Fe-S)-binding protein [Vulcanisaeta thermophila]|uniref:(Fe-S)-binding protein n=1 Tax=Vulcanisaeta thermophila TaxID=867917 RepID=UPI000853E148|nr:(Fe-S)-binding protein [Vulcanisaeta thermophila]